MSLVERGFYPVGEEQRNLLQRRRSHLHDQRRRPLRAALRPVWPAARRAKDEKKPDEKEKSSPALNRYLFVMAQFDESQIRQAGTRSRAGRGQPAERSRSRPKKSRRRESRQASRRKARREESRLTARPRTKKCPQKKTAADETKAEPPAAKTDAAAEEKPAEKPEAKPDAKPASPDEEKRIAIQKENKRKQDEYDDAIKKGEDHVKELNDRFADWYYIISDDVYKKIHLGRNEIVKKKETKEAAEPKPGGLGDLKEFEKGLKPDSDEPQK